MYHTVEYMLTTGRITKEKYKSAPPSNEVAKYTVKGFKNWTIGHAWKYYLHMHYEKFAKKLCNESRKGGALDD